MHLPSGFNRFEIDVESMRAPRQNSALDFLVIDAND
jgi:hypothetical protein